MVVFVVFFGTLTLIGVWATPTITSQVANLRTRIESLTTADGDPQTSLAHARTMLAAHAEAFDAVVLGMGEDAEAAGGAQHGDRLFGRRHRPGDVGEAFAAEVFFEGLHHAADSPHRHQQPGDMRPAGLAAA